MIGTEKLELIIELALWSGCLENERPLSLLIIAKPESGKSQLVLSYKGNNPGVVVISDCTAWGLQKAFLNEMKDKLIHHIIIPDLITPLSRQPATVATFVAFLNGLTEEGIVEVHTFAQDLKVEGLNVGLISTITPSILNDSRHRWTRMGFLSRMLPVAYKYSQETAQKVAHFPEKWLEDQKLDLNTRLQKEVLEAISKLIEAKILTRHVENLESAPLVAAIPPVLPNKPHLFLFLVVGLLLGSVSFVFGLALKRLFLGPTASLENLKQIGKMTLETIPQKGSKKARF